MPTRDASSPLLGPLLLGCFPTRRSGSSLPRLFALGIGVAFLRGVAIPYRLDSAVLLSAAVLCSEWWFGLFSFSWV